MTQIVYRRNGVTLDTGDCPDFSGGDICIIRPAGCRHRVAVGSKLHCGDLRGITCETVKSSKEFKKGTEYVPEPQTDKNPVEVLETLSPPKKKAPVKRKTKKKTSK